MLPTYLVEEIGEKRDDALFGLVDERFAPSAQRVDLVYEYDARRPNRRPTFNTSEDL